MKKLYLSLLVSAFLTTPAFATCNTACSDAIAVAQAKLDFKTAKLNSAVEHFSTNIKNSFASSKGKATGLKTVNTIARGFDKINQRAFDKAVNAAQGL